MRKEGCRGGEEGDRRTRNRAYPGVPCKNYPLKPRLRVVVPLGRGEGSGKYPRMTREAHLGASRRMPENKITLNAQLCEIRGEWIVMIE